MHTLQRVLSAALAVLYPQRCLGCEALIPSEKRFCQTCESAVRPITSPACERCGLPFRSGAVHLCYRCLRQPPRFQRARAWAYYEQERHSPQPLSAAIQRFKYQRNLSIGKQLAELGAEHCPVTGSDCIVPVPLAVERLRWRGFNQSLLLAQAIGEQWEVPVNPFVLVRLRSTRPQTQLTESERRVNVRDAFEVTDPDYVAGKSILIVDDVYTSGATVEECARTLSENGAAAIDVFTLARAVFR